MPEPTRIVHPVPEVLRQRGYLPHFDTNRPQFITMRLEGSLPREVYERIRKQHEHREEYQRQAKIRETIERYLDTSWEVCWLKDPRIASMVSDTLRFYDHRHYELHSWTIMPNHVHALLTPFPGHRLGSIIRRWKTWSARQANELLGRKGAFWSTDYFDRFMRTAEHMKKVGRYIENNPVTAGLCRSPEEWRWGSAAGRER